MASMEDTIPAVLMMTLVLVIALGVVMRYVFRMPQMWVYEIATVLFVWQVLLAAAGAVRRRMHIGMDPLGSLLNHRTRALQAMLIGLIVIGVALGLALLGFGLAATTTKSLQGLGWGYATVYAAVPVSGALIILHSAMQLRHAVRGFRANNFPRHTHQGVIEAPKEEEIR